MKIQLIKGACYILHLCLALLLTSCDVLFPDDDKPLPEKKCKIQKINTPWDDDTEYTYDALGKLIKLAHGVSLAEDVESATITFEYNTNGTLSKAYDDHGEEARYEYQDNKLVKTKHYSGTILHFIRDYIRDNKGNISEVLIYDHTNQLQRKYTYSYDATGNISQALKYWRIQDNIELLSTTTYSKYDNKKNVEPWYFLPGTLTMKNNPGVIAIQVHPIGGGSGSNSVDSLTYQYNTAGYPTSLQYKHNNEGAWNYQYAYEDCQ